LKYITKNKHIQGIPKPTYFYLNLLICLEILLVAQPSPRLRLGKPVAQSSFACGLPDGQAKKSLSAHKIKKSQSTE
jgi:hypothetical protein